MYKLQKLVAKVKSIDTSRFVSKTKYDTDKSEIENKTPDFSSVIKKTDYDRKITETENKLSDHSHDKYVTTLEFDTLT